MTFIVYAIYIPTRFILHTHNHNAYNGMNIMKISILPALSSSPLPKRSFSFEHLCLPETIILVLIIEFKNNTKTRLQTSHFALVLKKKIRKLQYSNVLTRR